MSGARKAARRGFTMIEALAALSLALLLFGSIALYTGTWLSHWERIIAMSSRADNVAVVLDRVVEDIESTAAMYASADAGRGAVVFEGLDDRLSFVRPALGYGPRAGADRITYLNGAVDGTSAIMRLRRDHGGQASGGEDLPLLRGGPTIRFTYAGNDGEFLDAWGDSSSLPQVIRIEIAGEKPRPWSRAAFALIRSEWPAFCGRQDMLDQCQSDFGS